MMVCEVPTERGRWKGNVAKGTKGGYQRHWKAGEPACSACLEAAGAWYEPASVRSVACAYCGDTFAAAHPRYRFCSAECRLASKGHRPSDFGDSEWRPDGVFIVGARYPSLDHVVPRSRGGSDDLANLRTAHQGCNAARGTADV